MNLSGGNQQKVVLAKWLVSNCSCLVFDEPTRGVDVGAKTEIYSLMNELLEQGVGILMISSDLPEVLGMSDRILVLREGKVAGEIPKPEFSQENVMKLAPAHDPPDPLHSHSRRAIFVSGRPATEETRLNTSVLAFLSILPVVSVAILLVGLRWPASRAMPICYLVCAGLALFVWKSPQ